MNKKSSSKNFYIILKEKIENFKNQDVNKEKAAIINLNDMYFKVKECLSRCGNYVFEIDTKEEIEEILFSFYNVKFVEK